MTSTKAMRPCVVVFGSTNLDVTMLVRSLPRPGETVLASSTVSGPGGKGANQAVAVARTGVPVVLLSAVGSDPASVDVLKSLSASGVDTSRMLVVDGLLTGRALITVDVDGENAIVIDSGANANVSVGYAHRSSDLIATARVLVVQGEVPAEATRVAISIAQHSGARVVANLAPYVNLGTLAAIADPVVVNEVEASEFLGELIRDAASVRRAADRIAEVCRSIVITLGPAGAVLVQDGTVTEFPAPPPLRVVDTTGAGDAFVGVMAAALAAGLPLTVACGTAVEAATRTVESAGAAATYPAFVLPTAADEFA